MNSKTIKIISALMMLILSVSLISGCAAPQTVTPQESLKPTIEADQTKQMIFGASRDQAPGQEDAHYCTINLGVWQPLITKDESGNPAPSLAESWTHNEDSTKWEFKLKEGVAFSNGVPFNADIVIANFERYKKGPFPSSFYGINIDTTYPNLESVIAVDEYIVQLNFAQPVPMLTYGMSNFGSSIFEPSCFAEDGNFNGVAIGTGPYKITENLLGEYCVIERNDNYYGEAPILKTIKFKVIADANTRYSALVSGEVDGLCDLGAITPSLAAELEKDKNYKVSVGDSGITHFLNVNGNKFPFNDVRMREGLSLLLNKQEIIDEFYNGYGIVPGSFLNYTSAFYKPIDPVYNKEKGLELIKEVIGDKEITLEFLIPTGDANRYPYQEEAVYIQAVLEEAGVHSNITLLEWGTCKEMMKAGDYNMCLKIQGLPSADPYSLFKGFMYSAGGTNINYGLGYKNEKVDELIEKVATETNVENIKEIYNELQVIASTDFPNIPMIFAQEVVACSAKVKEYKATQYGLEGYTRVCWSE